MILIYVKPLKVLLEREFKTLKEAKKWVKESLLMSKSVEYRKVKDR